MFTSTLKPDHQYIVTINISELVNIIQTQQVVAFRQKNNLWVIHPSAKIKLFWQSTHYDLEKNSMIDDCLKPDIVELLFYSGIVLDEPVVVMDSKETENILQNSNSNYYHAT